MTTRKRSSEPLGERALPSGADVERGATSWQAQNPSASGLYRVSNDNKLPFVHRGEAQLPAIGSTEGDEQDYPDPEIYEDTAAALLGGPHIREELRLDVDGYFPQMTASGTITRWLAGQIHWIAKLRPTGRFSWTGHIWFKDGATQLFPYTNVAVTVSRSLQPHQRRATVRFSGGGAPPRLRAFRYTSAFFREVELEFDHIEAITPVTQIATDAHPNRPPALPAEILSIETVFRRAGVRSTRGGDNVVGGAGADARWSDLEIHDAMQAYWSRFSDRPQGSLWTLFADRHESGASIGGIMLDDIGPNHRQGTALFYDSFISQAPAGDADPAAWVERMRFWTAVHQTGRAFNLAHSWQKSPLVGGSGPWVPLADEREARSFMNYPYHVSGGQTAFFADFEFRFSDSELLFMRHAPGRFAQLGNADWFDHHGFEQINRSPEPTLELQLRVNRSEPRFEFLEPVVLELRLRNSSGNPQLLPDTLLSNTDNLTIIVKKQDRAARGFLPYARYCQKPGQAVLRTGQSLYSSLFVAAGRGGWYLAEPGNYLVQVCLHRDNEDILSNPLALRIAPPLEREDELLAQDFFSDEVARTLAFDGSRYFDRANAVLEEVSARLANRRVARHAQIALRLADLRSIRTLDTRESKLQFNINPPRLELAVRALEPCLAAQPNVAAETLGHIDYNYYAQQFADAIEREGSAQAAALINNTLQTAAQTLQERGALQSVVHGLRERASEVDSKIKAA